ncbi:MAG: putative ABC transporter permease, partial [Sphaerochaetaceae bacterium]
MAIIETYFLWFFFYSVIGWIYETILCSVAQKRFINRGFFNGPYCPIYGFGALLNILLLSEIKNLFLLFLAAFLLTTILEYVSSWGLEKLFHARWWD